MNKKNKKIAIISSSPLMMMLAIIFIENGGWHFSYLKDPSSIQKKISSYSHQEFNTPKFNRIESIQKRISENVDLFDRKIKYKVIKLDKNFSFIKHLFLT